MPFAMRQTKELIEHHPQGPPIDAFGVAFAFDHLAERKKGAKKRLPLTERIFGSVHCTLAQPSRV